MTAPEKATKDMQRLERELGAKRAALVEAKTAQADAERKYDASQNDIDLDLASKARLKTESLYRQMVSAQEALKQAKAEHQRLHVAALCAELDAARPKLETWTTRLPLDAFAALDAQVDRAVLDAVRVVASAQAEHDRLTAIAQEAGQHFSIPRPTIGDALLQVQRELAVIREKEDRDPVAEWLADPPGHGAWQMRGMSATEIQQAQTMAQINSAIETRETIVAAERARAAAQNGGAK